jgi:hypothetical protein
MGTPKRRTKVTRKRAKPATLKLQDLRTATAASIRAVLGKGFPKRPGVVAGFWLDEAFIKEAGLKPNAIAKTIARQASAASGVKLTPGIIRGEGGILVGYVQPAIFNS